MRAFGTDPSKPIKERKPKYEKTGKPRHRRQRHGMTGTPEYFAYQALLRKIDPLQEDSKYYGQQGIGMCAEWQLFENFYKDMGKKPEGMSLQRHDETKDFTPENCYWGPAQLGTRKRMPVEVELDERRYKKPRGGSTNRTHRQTNTRAYASWTAMKTACNNPRSGAYARVGRRGIRYYDLWKRFNYFYKDMGPCPEGMTLRRYDETKNFTPSNCYWGPKRPGRRKGV